MDYRYYKAGLQIEAASKGLLAVAVVGWGLFAYSALSSGSEEEAVQTKIAQLREQVETIGAERDQLARERDQRNQTGQNLQNMQTQIEAAIRELQDLDSLRASVSQAIEQERARLAGLSNRPSAKADSITGSTASTDPLSKEQIRAAQEALADFGYGDLKADGLLGPSTRKAVEAFQRAKGFRVTGELEPSTLRALKTHTASMAQ
ncbi:peptidoglycan-binding protein [Microvirga sp. G4-2]|uniref:peptidoglycan-binding protein n=1 Tax=Microvirga sp. G4-2 TaxID=3434467 RepID=UPI00404478AF